MWLRRGLCFRNALLIWLFVNFILSSLQPFHLIDATNQSLTDYNIPVKDTNENFLPNASSTFSTLTTSTSNNIIDSDAELTSNINDSDVEQIYESTSHEVKSTKMLVAEDTTDCTAEDDTYSMAEDTINCAAENNTNSIFVCVCVCTYTLINHE